MIKSLKNLRLNDTMTDIIVTIIFQVFFNNLSRYEVGRNMIEINALTRLFTIEKFSKIFSYSRYISSLVTNFVLLSMPVPKNSLGNSSSHLRTNSSPSSSVLNLWPPRTSFTGPNMWKSQGDKSGLRYWSCSWMIDSTYWIIPILDPCSVDMYRIFVLRSTKMSCSTRRMLSGAILVRGR